jgi:hypothetical protein
MDRIERLESEQWHLRQRRHVRSAKPRSSSIPGPESRLRRGGDHLNVTVAVTPCPGMPAEARVSCVVPADRQTGKAVRNVGPGELPAWSRDGRLLYLARRAIGATVHAGCPCGNLPMMRCEIWRANADASHLVQITQRDAYTFGPIQLSADGRTAVFSVVDNQWDLWRQSLLHGLHLLEGEDAATLLAQHGPRISIAGQDLKMHKLKTLVVDASRPAVQV